MEVEDNSVKLERKYPFKNMRLADHSILATLEGRADCSQCKRSRKFFCYNCYIPVGQVGKIIPKVKIPLQIDIIKHKKEIDGKSSAIHAAILSAENVRIFTYPDIPDYNEHLADTVLLFPGSTSVTVPQLFDRKVRLKTENNYGLPKGYNIGTLLRRRIDEVNEEKTEHSNNVESEKKYTIANLPIKRAVFIDSTWNQSRGIYKDERMRCLRTVVLQNRASQFWRHQRGSPRWYLATIEAIHQLLLEVHVNAWGLNPLYRGLDNLEVGDGFFDIAKMVEAAPENIEPESPYNGHYDNLLFFFAYMYDLIHIYYDHNILKSYKRPI